MIQYKGTVPELYVQMPADLFDIVIGMLDDDAKPIVNVQIDGKWLSVWTNSDLTATNKYLEEPTNDPDVEQYGYDTHPIQ